jgi:hypothetical protein
MRRRRSRKTGFDSKTVIDVGIAGITTRIIPQLVNAFLPLDPMLYTVAGAGGTFLVGSMLKKPVLANAGIALGLVELVAPAIEGVIGGLTGGGGTKMVPTTVVTGAPKALPMPPTKQPVAVALSDYMRLGEYTDSPAVQSNATYRNAY